MNNFNVRQNSYHRKSFGFDTSIQQHVTSAVIDPSANLSSIKSDSDYIDIDPRSHLEVSDTKHRYAKNLRVYFQEFVNSGSQQSENACSPISSHLIEGRCECTHCSMFAHFFVWLDLEEPKPELPSCPRLMLDTDIVQYLSCSEERVRFQVHVDCSGKFWCHESLVHTNRARASSSSSAVLTPSLTEGTAPGENINEHTQHCGIHDADEVVNGMRPMCTGQEGWIFVVRDDQLLANRKETKTFPRFHHSSFYSGDSVDFAGMFVIESGCLLRLYPHSGHYRPTERHLRNMLLFLQVRNVSLAQVQVDGQRVFRIARAVNTIGEKMKKVEVAHMLPADEVLSYLNWKHHRRESGLLARLDQAAIASGSTHSDKSGKRRCFTSVPAASPRPRDSSNGTSAFKYHNIRGHNHQQPTSPYISTLSRSLDNMSMQSPRALESGSTMPAGDALSRSAPLGRCEHNQKEFFSPNQAANACDGLSPELQLGKLTELSVVFPRATSSSRTDSMSEHALSGDSTDSNDGAPFPGFDVGLNEASIDWLPPELWTDFDDEDKSLDDGLAEERYMGDVLRLLLSESPTLRMMESSPPQKQGSSATSCMLDIVDVVDVVDVVGLRVECDPNSSPIVSKKSAHPF